MGTRFLNGPRVPAVTALPAAAGNAGRIFLQGGKFWGSNGTAWIDLSGGGDGGGVSGNTIGAIADFFGGGASYNTETDTFSAGTYSVGGANYFSVGDALFVLNSDLSILAARVQALEEA